MKHTTAKITLAAALAGGGILAISSSVGAKGVGLEKFKEMLVPSPQMVREGEEVYNNQCTSCHGEDGSGVAASEYPTERFANPVPNLKAGEYRFGGGPVQVYNTITLGLDSVRGETPKPAEGEEPAEGEAAEGLYHPTYTDTLAYEERWAVTHYVRSLGPTEGLTDPQSVVDAAKERAIKGNCDPELKETLSKRVKPPSEEMMEKAAEVYSNQCATCHGETGKGDGPAGGALQPPPRNFHAKDADWVNGTSPFGIFETLANGIEGGAMAAYPGIDVDVRWALAHYIRKWVPDEAREDVTDEQLLNVCRTRSAPPAPEPLTLKQAEKALLADQNDQRFVRLALYGQPEVAPDADAESGREIYEKQCQSCHGKGFQGVKLGPYGVRRAPSVDQELPVLYVKTGGLVAEHAGGDYRAFARRASSGIHASLPDMTAASLMSQRDWKDLHAYIASIEEEVEFEEIPSLRMLEGQPDGAATGASGQAPKNGEGSGEQDGEQAGQADTAGDSDAATEDGQ